MMYTFDPKGVCSRRIAFEIDDDGRLRNVTFTGGCHGNTQGISRLAEGMSAIEAVDRLRGIRCGMRQSSCPDQLARAIEHALSKDDRHGTKE